MVAVLKSRPTLLMAFLVALPSVFPSAAAEDPLTFVQQLVYEGPVPLPTIDSGDSSEPQNPLECVHDAAILYIENMDSVLAGDPLGLPDRIIQSAPQIQGWTTGFVNEVNTCSTDSTVVCFKDTTDVLEALPGVDPEGLPQEQVWAHSTYLVEKSQTGAVFQMVGILYDGHTGVPCPTGWG